MTDLTPEDIEHFAAGTMPHERQSEADIERERLAQMLYRYADVRDHANEPADVTYGIRLAAHIVKGILRIGGGER